MIANLGKTIINFEQILHSYSHMLVSYMQRLSLEHSHIAIPLKYSSVITDDCKQFLKVLDFINST